MGLLNSSSFSEAPANPSFFSEDGSTLGILLQGDLLPLENYNKLLLDVWYLHPVIQRFLFKYILNLTFTTNLNDKFIFRILLFILWFWKGSKAKRTRLHSLISIWSTRLFVLNSKMNRFLHILRGVMKWYFHEPIPNVLNLCFGS